MTYGLFISTGDARRYSMHRLIQLLNNVHAIMLLASSVPDTNKWPTYVLGSCADAIVAGRHWPSSADRRKRDGEGKSRHSNAWFSVLSCTLRAFGRLGP